jgi:hypothetical protein
MNLVTNPGFQTGTFAGWTNTGATISTSGRPVGPLPYYCARLSFSANIDQNLAVTPSTFYYYSFWARSDTGGGTIIISGFGSVSPTTTWTRYDYTLTTGPSQTVFNANLSIVLFSPAVLIDDVWFSTSPPPGVCYPGDTLIKICDFDGSNVRNERVDKIKSGRHWVVNDKGEHIPIVRNVCSGTTDRLIVFEKDSLGCDKPSQTLSLTSGHRIVYQGKEIKASAHPDGKRVRCDPTKIYTLICPRHQTIYANDTLISAFGVDEWLKIGKFDHQVL